MKKYQVVDAFGEHMHAGSKATNDCMDILSDLGFEKCILKRNVLEDTYLGKIKRQVSYFFNWRKIYKQVEENSVVVLQNPFRRHQTSRFSTLKKLKENKNVKFISIIHDVDMIRESYKNYKTEKEFNEMLEIADKLIVHNDKMKAWFIEKGIEEERLVTLEIFDYLNEDSLDKEIEFSKKIQLAGNLSLGKSPYVYKLQELSTHIDLYGVEYAPQGEFDNITYHGAFPADEIPKKFTSGFGLVWDGTSLDTCDGDTGRYLKYNNPHKLSLYLSSSIPVIIWDQAAEADFVNKYNVGLTVSSLRDVDKILENLTKEQYQEMVRNVKEIQKKLKAGHYLKTAIEKSIQG